MKSSLLPALPAIAMTSGCAARDRYATTVRSLRHPLIAVSEPTELLRELVRCATLAPNGHNTQPWKFNLGADRLSILPDFSRRTAAVDPDDHHLWISLGCATENLVLAAAALGRHADVEFSSAAISVVLTSSAPARSPLVDAIFRRQSTRADYDGRPLPNEVLTALGQAADRPGVQCLLLTDPAKVGSVLEYVTQANDAQMNDAGFLDELKHWIRFDDAQAIATGDGLFSRCSGNPALPPWLGRLVLRSVLNAKSENKTSVQQLRSSAGVAVFVGDSNDRSGWFSVGRAYERFALAATVQGVRTAFVNQPIEVPAVRSQFAGWLGVGSQRPDLVVRFGRGALLPYSMRRPVTDVIIV